MKNTSVALHEAAAPLNFRTDALLGAALKVSDTPVDVCGWNITNPTADNIFVKFYDIKSTSVNVGTSAVISTVMVPAQNQTTFLFDNVIDTFPTALSMAAVKEAADTGTTAPASALIVEIYYW